MMQWSDVFYVFSRNETKYIAKQYILDLYYGLRSNGRQTI